MRLSGIRKTESKNWFNVQVWLLAVSFISLCLLIPQAGFAAWGSAPIAVAADANEQCRPQVVYDGSGGYYVVWQDNTDDVIFAQHYNAQGDTIWAAPLQVSLSGASDAYGQESTADGSGGLLVSWYDNSYTRVQRVNADGTVAWTDGGIEVLDAEDSWIAADGSGGAIVMSYGGGVVNRIAADGSLPWADADTAITFSTSWSATKIVSDGAGGAILLWEEFDAFEGIAVQRIDSDGNFVWNSGTPVQLSADGADPSCPRLIQQGNGAIVAWYDSTDEEVLAQKINGAGAIQWTAGGVVVVSSTSPEYPALASDNAGGAFITWEEGDVVNAQYINTNGSAVWAAPVAMSTDADVENRSYHPQNTISDGQGGFITTWSNNSYEIRAQRCNAAGAVQWTATGALIAPGESIAYAPKLTSNGQGGAVMVWVDNQAATGSNDIFMQGVSASGVAGEPGYTPLAPAATPTSGSGSSGCFVNTLGTFSATPAAGIVLFLTAGMIGLVAVRRR